MSVRTLSCISRIRILSALITALALIGNVSAQSLEINLNQDSARFTYSSLVGGSNYGRTELNAGFLYNESDNVLFDLGLQVIDVAGSKTPGLQIGVGPRVYYVDSDEYDGSGVGVALGGNLRYKLSGAPRMSLAGTAYYAPSITSTLDVESLFELGLRVSYEMLPTANVYLGYRRIRVDLGKPVGYIILDKGAIFGMKFTF